MSTPLSSSGINASLPSTPQAKPATAKVLDFMIVTSRTDLASTAREFAQSCKLSGLAYTIVYIEDLKGNTAGEKLQRLQLINREWQSMGFIARSTIKVVLLHGNIYSAPKGVREIPDFHAMGVSAPDLCFSTEAFDAAMRNITSTEGKRSVGFSDTIIYGSCKVGDMRQAFKNSGGSYVLLAGKKSALETDCIESIADLIQESGKRKRENSPPLSDHECWERVSKISGEHIAYVKGEVMKISKVAPKDNAFSGIDQNPPSAKKIVHSLRAKLLHGTLETVQHLFQLWGPDAIQQAMQSLQNSEYDLLIIADSTERQFAEKLELLGRYGMGLPDSAEQILSCVKRAISKSSEKLLSAIFEKYDSGAGPFTSAIFLDWLKTSPSSQTALASLCDKHPELKNAFKKFLQPLTVTQLRALPVADLLLALRHIVMPPFLAGLPQWLTESLIDASVIPASPPGEAAEQIVFNTWRSLIEQRRYEAAADFIDSALVHSRDDIERVLREKLSGFFAEAVESRNVKLTRRLIMLDVDKKLHLGLASRRPGTGWDSDQLDAFFKEVLPNS